MKLWRLVSVLDGDTDHAVKVAANNEKWNSFAEALQNFPQLVNHQDRSMLDLVLPEEFVCAVLSKRGISLFVSPHGVIRSRRLSSSDIEVSATDVFKRFGGIALEEAVEFGSYKPE